MSLRNFPVICAQYIFEGQDSKVSTQYATIHSFVFSCVMAYCPIAALCIHSFREHRCKHFPHHLALVMQHFRSTINKQSEQSIEGTGPKMVFQVGH